jgi:hypothetical protein
MVGHGWSWLVCFHAIPLHCVKKIRLILQSYGVPLMFPIHSQNSMACHLVISHSYGSQGPFIDDKHEDLPMKKADFP